MIDDGTGLQGLYKHSARLMLPAFKPLILAMGSALALLPADFATSGADAELDANYSKSGEYTVTLDDNDNTVGYMNNVDDAIEEISSRLQTLGSLSSRLTLKEENLATAQIDAEAAYDRIMNADMAMSQMEATKFQILQQTATTMLAQANQAPQGLLSLFR